MPFEVRAVMLCPSLTLCTVDRSRVLKEKGNAAEWFSGRVPLEWLNLESYFFPCERGRPMTVPSRR